MRSWVYLSKLALRFNKKGFLIVIKPFFFRRFSFGGPFLRCSSNLQHCLLARSGLKCRKEINDHTENHLLSLFFCLQELMEVVKIYCLHKLTVLLHAPLDHAFFKAWCYCWKPPKLPTTCWFRTPWILEAHNFCPTHHDTWEYSYDSE